MLYSIAVRLNNFLFDRHWRKIQRVSVPVISVGNISTGGSGKSPLVQTLVELLLSKSIKPAIISRGYGRKSKGEVVVSDGNTILASVDESGDELMMHAMKYPIPIIANTNRFDGATTAIAQFGAQVIILDDGFQHRELHRDVDIVIVDEFTLLQTALLPIGRLREPFESLKRAQVICLPEHKNVDDIPINCSHTTILGIRIESGKLYSLPNGLNQWTEHAQFVMGEIPKNVVALSGIALPDRFEKTLLSQELNIVKHIKFSDHHRYISEDCHSVIKQCLQSLSNTIITTEKDSVKLQQFSEIFYRSGIKIYCLPVSMKIIYNYEKLQTIIDLLISPKG